MPILSIIVPVYNVSPYLREGLDSILNQEVQDIEIIYVYAAEFSAIIYDDIFYMSLYCIDAVSMALY